eukprot:3900996-Rhodomonas_salina.2
MQIRMLDSPLRIARQRDQSPLVEVVLAVLLRLLPRLGLVHQHDLPGANAVTALLLRDIGGARCVEHLVVGRADQPFHLRIQHQGSELW